MNYYYNSLCTKPLYALDAVIKYYEYYEILPETLKIMR